MTMTTNQISADENYAHKTLVENLELYDGIRIGHINSNGLVKKIHEIKILLTEGNFDVLAVTETHLSCNVTNDEVTIDGYEVLRKDRNDGMSPWGGVAVFFKDSLNVSELLIDFNIESIWLNIIIKGQTFLLGCVYRPPSDKKFLQNFKLYLDHINHRTNIMIVGDTNFDLNPCNDINKAAVRDYISILNTYHLQNIIKENTRISQTSQTLIDHILVTDKSKVVTQGVFDPCISDHCLIYIVLSFKQQRKSPIYIMVKNYKDVEVKALQTDIQQIPWSVTSVFDDIEDTNSVWNDMYQAVLKGHVKTRKVKVRSNSLPWMNSILRKMMNRRYKLLIAAQKTEKGSKKRKAKELYWKDNFSKANSSKEFWSLVKQFQGK